MSSTKPSILGSFNFTVAKVESSEVPAFEKIQEQLKYINNSLVDIKLSQMSTEQLKVIYLKEHQKPYYIEIIDRYKKLMGVNNLNMLGMTKDEIIQDISNKIGNVRPPERAPFVETIDSELRGLFVQL